jgi:hypothetical protein
MKRNSKQTTEFGDASTSERFAIQGRVSPGFEPVRQAFADNFVRRRELGGACAVYQSGKKVVDL